MKTRVIVTTWLFLAASGCDAGLEAANGRAGSVCATCEPEVGGDTGDFGGEVPPCWGLSSAVAVGVQEASALGFDVDELERRLARDIDLALSWRATATNSGEPASGYDAETRITAQVRSSGSYRHVRIDPSYCDGTTCSSGGTDWPQSDCPERLLTDVAMEVSTADGSVMATLHGEAWSLVGGSENDGAYFRPFVVINASAPLAEVAGSLRVYPEPGAVAYRSALRLSATLSDTELLNGALSPTVFLDLGNDRGEDYWPLSGAFGPQR